MPRRRRATAALESVPAVIRRGAVSLHHSIEGDLGHGRQLHDRGSFALAPPPSCSHAFRPYEHPGSKPRADPSAWLWTTTLADCVTGGAFAAMLIGPLYAREHLHGALSWGTITGTLAAATSIGSTLAARWPSRRPGILMSLATASTAAGFAAMSANLPLPLIVAGALLAGIAFGPSQVARVTAPQRHIPIDQFGRVSAYQELVTVLPTPIVYAAAGVAADTLGSRTVLAVCAALIAVPALISLTIPSVRRLTTGTMPDDRRTAAPCSERR
ncbi:hypothetical protein [Actinoallomurus sp. NPDC050550]|uniref:hypothetical protein n=1 Tax=Actinoallomurus sp. NPDC050550 TaxID=3154937 RepID=UPI0033BFDB18